MTRWFIGAAMAITLAGCQTGGIGMPGSPAWMMSTSPEQKADFYRSQCVGYGFKQGTPGMAQCMQTEAASARSAASSRMDSLNAMNAANQRSMQTTTCRPVGNMVQCSTF
jgi:hypothetical protein